MAKQPFLETSGQTGDWLEGTLRISQELALFEVDGPEPEDVPADFQARCDAAAWEALATARLRRERSRIGFLPLPLADYLQELAESAKLELQPLLALFGLRDLEDLRDARPLARLCHRLGFPLREALLHFGLGVAERLGAPPVSMVLARRHRSGGGHDPLAESEEHLRSTLAEVGGLAELQALEAEFRSAYEEPADDR